MTGRRFRMDLSLDDCRWAVLLVGILLCHLEKFRMALWPLSSAGSNRQRHSEWKLVQDEIGHRMRFIMDLNILPRKPPMYRHDVIFGPDRLVLTTCTKSEQRKHVTALDPDRGTSGRSTVATERDGLRLFRLQTASSAPVPKNSLSGSCRSLAPGGKDITSSSVGDRRLI